MSNYPYSSPQPGAQGYAPPSQYPQSYDQQGYGQQGGYPPQQPPYGGQNEFGPPKRQDSYGPPQHGGFQHGQSGNQFGAYDASNPQGHPGY